jgi:glycosyltransferase involved in cell wall biosynthesis
MTAWLVAQLGARMHYAVPRILNSAGMLEALCTDVCAGRWAEPLSRLPAGLLPAGIERLAGRVPSGLPRRLIRTFPLFGLGYAARRAAARTPAAMTAVHLWAGSAFCDAIVREGLGKAGAVYTFNSAGLGLLNQARELGLATVVEQTIAPAPIEDALLAEEREAFPDWQPALAPNRYRAAFQAREAGEWESADLVVCGSEFVRDGIRRCGGPLERTAVVPYGVDAPFPPVVRSLSLLPLRVLTVGEVSLRKGTPYLLDAATKLKKEATFRLVGSINVAAGAERRLADAVELTGPVPRRAIAWQLAWADVLLLPSLCEGSATVCYEAFAAGLPVITTPNAGSVVRHGIDGFIVPIRDAEAIVAAIDTIRLNPSLLYNLSRNAALRAREFTVERYGERLLEALSRVATWGRPFGLPPQAEPPSYVGQAVWPAQAGGTACPTVNRYGAPAGATACPTLKG